MANEIVTSKSIERRQYWITELAKISGRFGEDATRVNAELETEIANQGTASLLDHLRLCGSIPESYGHDTTVEKLYSKYTDALLAAAFRHIGLKSLVLTERADCADVEVFGEGFSLVADAKVFRLSRTAKNQKDFKIEALHRWKRGKPHAMVVCPIYQLPTRASQIYQQAIARKVCIFSYAHLAVLTQFSDIVGAENAQALLLRILGCAESLNPTKDSVAYWTCLNRTMLDSDQGIRRLWQDEKLATIESIAVAKDEALTMLAQERERIARMSHDEAIGALLRKCNLEGRTRIVQSISDTGIFSIS